MSLRKRKNIAVKSFCFFLRILNKTKREIIEHHRSVQLFGHTNCPQRFHFTCENKLFKLSPVQIISMIKQRLLTKTVTCNQELLRLIAPQCKGKHAIKFVEALNSPMIVSSRNYFCIGLRRKAVTLFLQLIF